MTRLQSSRFGLWAACLLFTFTGCQWGVHPFGGSADRGNTPTTSPSGREITVPEEEETTDGAGALGTSGGSGGSGTNHGASTGTGTTPGTPSGETPTAGMTTGGTNPGGMPGGTATGTTAAGSTPTTTTGASTTGGGPGGVSGTGGSLTAGATSGTGGSSGSGDTGTASPPTTQMTPATPATPASLWACYQFAYASSKEGADNIYLKSNCGGFPEYKLTNNTDAGVTYRNMTLRPDLGMVSADVENAAHRITGFQAWDIHRLDALSRVDVRYDVNNDAAPDFDQVHSLTWDGTGSFVSFLARDISANRPTARIQLGFPMGATSYLDPVYVPVVVPNAAGSYGMDRLMWFSRNYPDRGYDMLVLSASRGAGQPTRIYSRDLNVRTSDDLSEILSTDEPAKSQTKPAVSRDGNKLAFVKANDANQPSIWTTSLTIVDKDVNGHDVVPRHIIGNGAVKLADGDSPCWTHDAEALMFEKDGKFYLMKADGSASTEIAMDAGSNPHSLACSPKLPMLWMARATTSVTVQPAQPPKATIYQRPVELIPYTPAGTSGGSTGGTTTP